MDIYYEVYGSGDPVICLHGNQENRRLFYPLKDDLKEYQLILIDSRYHGKSAKSGELSLTQMAKDVMGVADKLGLTAYDVIGFSDGANIALTLALMDDRLKAMILMSPNSSPKGIKGFYRFQDVLTLICLLPFCLYNAVARRKFKLTKWMLEEPHFDADYLSQIVQPVLLLSADRDMIKKEDIDFIASALPHCVNEVINNSSHFMLDDAYREVLNKIGGFLYALHAQTDN